MKIVALENMTLLEALVLLSPESSKNTLRSWLEKGRVAVDGKIIQKPNFCILKGQEISLGKRTHFIEGGVQVLYEDEHLIVIDKPEGLLSVSTDFEKVRCAHSLLKERYHAQRVFPVHRLDRETSGVMVFAYSEKAREHLKELFYKHAIERRYVAVVEGHFEVPFGTWESYLAEGEDYVVRNVPDEKSGRLAITHYEVLSKNRSFTLLRLTLETGRKNQIRVHCQTDGHPIYGDKKYGAKHPHAPRLFLHAEHLAFTHPETRKKLTFSSPIPAPFLRLFPRAQP